MDIKNAPNRIESADPIKATLSNLFYGWGYNFYRKENQLRSDDLLIRGKVSDLLGEARSHLLTLETAFRKDRLPPPSREHPFPDPAALHTVQSLQSLVKDIEQVEVRIRTAAVPEMDRVNQRHRIERGTLENLAAIDLELVNAVLTFQQSVLSLTDGPAAVSAGPQLLQRLPIDAIWQRRQTIVSSLA